MKYGLMMLYAISLSLCLAAVGSACAQDAPAAPASSGQTAPAKPVADTKAAPAGPTQQPATPPAGATTSNTAQASRPIRLFPSRADNSGPLARFAWLQDAKPQTPGQPAPQTPAAPASTFNSLPSRALPSPIDN